MYSQNPETAYQYQDSIMYKGRHHKHQACAPAPHARDCWEVYQLGVTPFLWSGYGHRETPDLWSASVQGFTILESSRLCPISQLRRSHPVSLLRLQIALMQA